jgi:hypothetical protein
VAICTLAVALPAAAHAAANVVHDLRPVSGTAPFAPSCTPSIQPLPSDAPGEPRIAVDPRDPNVIVIAYGQLPSVLTMTSRDGGRSWTQALPPGLSRCTGGSTDFTGDPFASVGADGTAYLSSVPVALPLPNTTLLPRSWIAVNRSTDHATSWSAPAIVAPDDGSFWDKPAVTADTWHPGRAYVAFIKRTQPDGATAYVSVTRDGGRSFSAPLENIHDQQLRFPHDPQLLLLLDGTIVEIFVQFNESDTLPAAAQVPVQVMAMRSEDRGAHWSSPTTIAEVPNLAPTDPDSGTVIDAARWPSAAAAPDGTVYVAWAAIESRASAAVLVSKSADGGRTWSRPTPAANVAGQAWLPTIAVDPHGTVGVMWYEARRDRTGDGQFTTDVWFAHSHDHGARWEQAHLGGPFDMLSAGARNGRPFLGDYFGLAPLPEGFAAAFGESKPQSGDAHSAIFFARIGVETPSLALTVSPSRATVGRRTRFVFTVIGGASSSRKPVTGATIRFARRRIHTDRLGHASIRLTLRRRGAYVARATRSGFHFATAVVRAG